MKVMHVLRKLYLSSHLNFCKASDFQMKRYSFIFKKYFFSVFDVGLLVSTEEFSEKNV